MARLHEERMHVLARSELLEDLPDGKVPTVALLAGRRVSLGPRGSATEALARAILDHHGVEPEAVLALPLRDMQQRLAPSEEGAPRDLDAGFFCGGRPRLALHDLLRKETGIRLLGMEPEKMARLTLATSALESTVFEHDVPGAYGCPTCDVPTIATRAVLVTTADNPLVGPVARTIFQGAGVIPGLDEGHHDVAGIEQSLAAPLPSLLPHPDAVRVYEERGLGFVPEQRIIETLAGALGILAILVATYRGAHFLRQERLAERIHGRVLEVSLAATTIDSVQQLTDIRDDVRRRARRRWWRGGNLSKRRCHQLETMIEQRIDQARSTSCAALLTEARSLHEKEVGNVRSARTELRQRIWQHAQDGELGELQVLVALRALGDEGAVERP